MTAADAILSLLAEKQAEIIELRQRCETLAAELARRDAADAAERSTSTTTIPNMSEGAVTHG